MYLPWLICAGSSRDWAAKGPWILVRSKLIYQAYICIYISDEMQGIKAVIAESFERIHRSNLVGMGVLPLQYLEGQDLSELGLTGKELYSITLPPNVAPRQLITVEVSSIRKQ